MEMPFRCSEIIGIVLVTKPLSSKHRNVCSADTHYAAWFLYYVNYDAYSNQHCYRRVKSEMISSRSMKPYIHATQTLTELVRRILVIMPFGG